MLIQIVIWCGKFSLAITERRIAFWPVIFPDDDDMGNSLNLWDLIRFTVAIFKFTNVAYHLSLLTSCVRDKGYFSGVYKLRYRLALRVRKHAMFADDLDVAPDFFDYFSALYPLLAADSSLWCVSAWNDNGKANLIENNPGIRVRVRKTDLAWKCDGCYVRDFPRLLLKAYERLLWGWLMGARHGRSLQQNFEVSVCLSVWLYRSL